MRVSARADYAIRAAAELAAAESSLTTEALASAQAMPRKFLEGILSVLRREGIVVAQRGLGGGYRLARSPRDITLADIVRAVDGPLVFVRGERPSQLSYGGAADDLLTVWVALRASVRGVLESVTVADLASGSLPPEIAALVADEAAWENP
ncbi:Rrf2 family transcriptional regulator [Demequina capsici]|uniref:Rrf2 family transcriptional regulator n=1 Tax=Demequina capsici TaxID=3075620 RepID=A0AA96J5P1_9MICO|nr:MULTISPECIES: Rrf2 family transcriptional regulator [unclassified Demequina]WNM23217.1 Rrf2 family transcriptional regulator [Demequina sp. OYTSA14]WNM26096.1 Rrf2 family transcriptional regulator [Demequina sp. PMTSA13]